MSVDRVDVLELDVDTRLLEVWAAVDGYDFDDAVLAMVGCFARAAYVRGYADALTEPKGKLFRENGYRVPKGAGR